MPEIKSQYCRVPIALIKKYANDIPFDIFLRLSDAKIVKIAHKDSDFIDIFNKYQAKGVEEVFALQEQYTQFLASLKDQLAYKLFDPATTVNEQVEILDASHQVVKEHFQKLGINDTVMEVAKEVANASLRVLKSHHNVFEFFNKFKNSCSEEYLRAILTSYMNTYLLDFFEWSTSAIKEKTNLATMLRDVLLTKEEFQQLERAEEIGIFSGLKKEILDHPTRLVQLLNNDTGHKWVPIEVLSIIEQHHERPDGKGFPKEITANKITQLSAIHIVAYRFINMMIKEKFDIGKRDEILAKLADSFQSGARFKKAIKALYQALDIKVK